MASPTNKINSDPFPEDCAVLVRYPLPATTTKSAPVTLRGGEGVTNAGADRSLLLRHVQRGTEVAVGCSHGSGAAHAPINTSLRI